jgi:hypothetical protein
MGPHQSSQDPASSGPSPRNAKHSDRHHSVDKALRADIIGAFTTVYLTAMSIVQGVAFGYLMLRLYEDRANLQFYEWLLAVATGMILVSIWHEYAYLTVLFSWIPTVKDSFIPYAFGAAQFWLISSITNSLIAWFQAVTGLLVVVVLAILNTLWRLRKDAKDNEVTLQFISSLPCILRPSGALFISCAILSVTLVITFLGAPLQQHETGRNLLAIGAVLLEVIYYCRPVRYKGLLDD